MPPTKHMTGDVFRGYLLDGFFNLVGALTGQGILLVGHDDRGGRHAVPLRPRPGPAERPLRPRRRRPAARGLPPAARRVHPDPGPPGPRRGGQLLERITDEPGKAPLLEAIGDGTFGLMKRPADRGKGYDGVVTQGDGYWNPATEILEGRAVSTPEAADRAALRRHHRRRHGAGLVHPAGRRTTSGPRARRCSWPRRWAWTRRCWCTPRRWVRDFTFFVVYGAVNHLVDLSEVQVLEREYPLLTRQGGQRADQEARLRRKLVVIGACIGTDAHTVGIDAILNIKGFAGREGPGVLPGDQGREPRRPGAGARPGRPGPRGEGRRRAGLPGRHPARRPPDQHPRDVGGVPRGLPGRPDPRCWSSAAPASTSTPPPSSASTGSSAAAPRPARSPATSCTPWPPGRRRRDRR